MTIINPAETCGKPTKDRDSFAEWRASLWADYVPPPKKKPEPMPELRVYEPHALVANPDGTVDCEDLSFVLRCLHEQLMLQAKQVMGRFPSDARVRVTLSLEF